MSDVRKWDDGLDVPIFVSVTGHVDLVDDELSVIRGKIEAFFDKLACDYPNTRIIVMSALAEGADLLVADIALKRNIHVAPVLPMPIDEYMQTFGDSESISLFKFILDSPLSYSPHILETDSSNDRDSFRNLSSFLIFNSHIMIGLWDGREYDRNGGTYDTIRMAYEGVDADIRKRYLDTVVCNRRGTYQIRYLDSAEDCLIYRISVSRQMSDEDLIARGCRNPKRVKAGDGFIVPQMVSFDSDRRSVLDVDLSSEIPPSYDSAFKRIDTMNKDMGVTTCNGNTSYSPGSVASCTHSHEKRGSRFHLLDTSDVSDVVARYVDEFKASDVMDAAADRYHIADQMALDNQNVSFSRIHQMILVTVLTGLSFSVFILSGGSLVVNLIYTVLMLLGIFMSKLHARRKTYSKFIEYRALAESMRVEYYRGLMGSRESIPELCYGYMKNELFWIRSVLKSWNSDFMNDFDRVTSIEGYEDKALAISTECWMRDQKNYHKSKRDKNAKLFERNSRISQVLVTATTVISALLIITMAAFPDILGFTVVALDAVSIGGVTLIQSMDVTMSVIIRVVMIVLVALISYESFGANLIHGGTPEQIDAKRQMFAIAEIRLGETEDPEVRRQILWELGDQCIDEMNDWVFEHKAKDFKGGTLNANPMDTDS